MPKRPHSCKHTLRNPCQVWSPGWFFLCVGCELVCMLVWYFNLYRFASVDNNFEFCQLCATDIYCAGWVALRDGHRTNCELCSDPHAVRMRYDEKKKKGTRPCCTVVEAYAFVRVCAATGLGQVENTILYQCQWGRWATYMVCISVEFTKTI